MDVDQTRAASGFSSGKGKDKKSDKTKDQKPTARSGDTNVQTAGLTADGKSAASADNDGDVAAVMEVDDAAMGLKRCFGVTSLCAVGSAGSLSLDSGSEMCSRMICQSQVRRLYPCWLDRRANMRWRQPPRPESPRCATISCRWGMLVRKGFSFTLGPQGCSMEKDGRSMPLYLERNSLRVEAHVLQRASRSGYVGAGGQLLRMSTWMTYTSKILTPRRVPIRLWNRQLKWH